jgi:hypothetical protein
MPETADMLDLMRRLRWLVDRTVTDRWFDVTVLPQLHVLAWGNSAAFNANALHKCRHCQMSVIGTKRTSACALHMSAFDPKRTFAGSLLPHLRGCKFSQYDGSVGA